MERESDTLITFFVIQFEMELIICVRNSSNRVRERRRAFRIRSQTQDPSTETANERPRINLHIV